MKQFICIWGALTLIFMDWGFLFKIMHYPGGNILLLLSMGLMMPVLIGCTAQYIKKK